MNSSFQGCPLFLEHVDEVPEDLRQLKVEADGWVIRSFFNEADGKTWAEFIVVSPRAEWAIKNGYTLSNAYEPKGVFGPGGVHNGVEYDSLITDGEFEHLALVKTPRYEESIILSPQQFKTYNNDLSQKRFRLANSKQEKTTMGKFHFFKKAKVENEIDESMSVTLPKSGKEVTLTQIITNADEMAMNADKPIMAEDHHMVKMANGEEMSIADFKKKHEDCMNELKAMKEKSEGVENEEEMSEGEPVENADGDSAVQKAEHEEEEIVEKKAESKKQNSKKFVSEEEKAKRARNLLKLQNASQKNQIEEDVEVIDLSFNKLQRGKERWG